MKEYIVLVFTKRMGACNMWPAQHVEAIRAFADTKEHAAEAAEQKLISENAGLDVLCIEKTAVCEADQVPVVCWQKGAP